MLFFYHELAIDIQFMIEKLAIIHREISIDNLNRSRRIDVISSKVGWSNHYAKLYKG